MLILSLSLSIANTPLLSLLFSEKLTKSRSISYTLDKDILEINYEELFLISRFFKLTFYESSIKNTPAS